MPNSKLVGGKWSHHGPVQSISFLVCCKMLVSFHLGMNFVSHPQITLEHPREETGDEKAEKIHGEIHKISNSQTPSKPKPSNILHHSPKTNYIRNNQSVIGAKNEITKCTLKSAFAGKALLIHTSFIQSMITNILLIV